MRSTRSLVAAILGAGLAMVATPVAAQPAQRLFTAAGLILPVGDGPVWDDTSTDVYVVNQRIRDASVETYGWSPQLSGRVLNGRDGDVVIVTVKQGRRAIGSQRCELRSFCDQRSMLTEGRAQDCGYDYGGLTPYARVENCRMDDIVVQGAGDFSLELAYEDMNTGDRTTFRTLEVPVMAHARMIDRRSRSHTAQYVPMPRDMVGSSWIELDGGQFGTSTVANPGQPGTFTQFEHYAAVPSIHFFALTGESRSRLGDAALRCAVNGEPIRLDQSRVRLARDDGQEGEDWRTQDGNEVTRVKWGYTHFELSVPWRILLRENERQVSNEGGGQFAEGGMRPGSTPERFDLSSQQGDYTCKLLLDGNEVRTFRFTVGPRGIVPHREQLGPEGVRAVFGRYFIETEIPAGAALDQVFDQRAARASGFWGRPWTSAVSGMLAAFPRSTREQGPPPVPRGRR